jgi:hypothetical protein
MALDEETVEIENRLPSNDFTEFEEVQESTSVAEPTKEEPKKEPKKVVEEQPKVETPQPTTPSNEFEDNDLDF